MASRVTAPLASLLLLLLGAQKAVAACTNVTVFSTQLDTLLAEYDREAMPSSRVKVELSLDVRHATVNEQTSSVRMLADLKMSWDDKRLTWNVSDWGCDSAPVSAERLWLPDVALVSAATQGAETEGQRARIVASGRVSWTSRLDLSAPVALKLDDWPRDVHTILFKFASRDHDSDQIDLSLREDEHVTVFESGAWELVGVSRSSKVWLQEGRERQLATWKLALRRRAPAHSVATGFVLAACVLLLLAALPLPLSERSPLFACASFTAALWLMSALARVPGGAGVPRAVAALGALCACGGAAALCAALLRRTAAARAPPPRRLRACLSAAAQLCDLAPPQGTSGSECSAWAAAAQLLDYVLQAALVLTVFVIVCVYL
ncbi:unnamed protein product [Parnassius mnemosyne]|uniref:Neurotransmitter-gated ion-channel ligand-binding domain-containing protein n=1 Tax=Parnassius mnemosyne TaxID=213953 RepID=A0AAV1M557_9NEOP